jgi:CDP-diacylglycerol--serine O-phosphatidyltransferase
LSRLARYNVTAEALTGDAGKVKYFEGTPIPTSVVPLALLMIAFHHRNLLPANIFGVEIHLLSLVFFLSGCLMISKSLHIPKL